MNFLAPVKESAGRWLARVMDRGNEVGAKLRRLTSFGIDIYSPRSTPIADDDTPFEDFFNLSVDLPSPPRSNLTMGDVNQKLTMLYPNFAQLRDSVIPGENEQYCKLAYAVGKGFFDHLVARPRPKHSATDVEFRRHYQLIDLAKIDATLIIDRRSESGKRFHALFSAHDADDRQWTLAENNEKKMGIEEYEYYIKHERLPDVAKFRNDRPWDIYEVFNDKVTFPNLRTHYRVQGQGNCFAQAAILQHLYLQLVHSKQLKKEEAYISDLSRFMRNFYDAEKLYKYIVEHQGGSFHAVLNKLLGGVYDVPEEFGLMPFDGYVSKLKKHGPAIIKMFVGDDFKCNDKYKYEGIPPEYADNEKEGHAMLLVGVMRVGEDDDLLDGTDLYFIFQNFWQDKQFLMVRRDYFRACSVSPEGGAASVNFVVYKEGGFESASPEDIYAKKAKYDVSLSSHLLERPHSVKRMLRLISVDSNFVYRHTRWE
jgi:hypothetical protein